MTAPTSGRDDATVRGAIVLIVAIVIGLALLARSGGGGGDDEAADTTTTASTVSTEAGAADTSDDTTVPVGGSASTASSTPNGTLAPADTLVVVLNATEQVGWADENASTLVNAGYQTDIGNPAAGNTDTSVIYAEPEAQANAEAIAGLLDLPDATISPKPAEPLGTLGQDADAAVVVVLGADSISG